MENRRDFLKKMASVGIASAMPSEMFARMEIKKHNNEFIWANLLH